MYVLKIVLAFLGVSALIYVAYLVIGDNVVSPCSPSRFPGRCYHTTQPVCDVVWNNSEKTCKEWIKKFDFPPGRLTSPIIEKCRHVEFDKVFRQSLKSTAECEDFRRDLEQWKLENL